MSDQHAPPPGDSRRGAFRIVFYLLLALAALDVVVATRRSTWRAYDPDDYGERVRGCRREGCDLLLVGGSPVSEGLNPAVLAGLPWRGGRLETVYNLGLPGATASEVWHAVEHGVRTPPRLLVYGISASDLNDERDEPHGPRVLMDAADLAVWTRLRPEAAGWCVRQYARANFERCWGLYTFRNGIRLWAADGVERLWPGACPEAAAEGRDGLRRAAAVRSGHGFSPRPAFQRGDLTALKAAGSFGAPFPFLDGYHLGGHVKYLRRLLDWAGAHGVAVVFVDMPVSADLEERLHPDAFAAFRVALAGVGRGRDVRVLTATRAAVGLGDHDFADLIHLNAGGGARFSAWLRERLSERPEEAGS